MKLTRKSIYSGRKNEMEIPITPKQYRDWMVGDVSAFELFPFLDSAQMDFLITGMTVAEKAEIRAELIASGELEIEEAEVIA